MHKINSYIYYVYIITYFWRYIMVFQNDFFFNCEFIIIVTKLYMVVMNFMNDIVIEYNLKKIK